MMLSDNCLICIIIARDCLGLSCGRRRRLLTGFDLFLFRLFRRGRCNGFCGLRFLVGGFLVGGRLLLF